MKKKELKDLRVKDYKELKKILSEKRLEVARVKADLKVSHEKNLKKAKNLSHDIAQILTIIKEKEIIEEGLQTQRPEISLRKSHK